MAAASRKEVNVRGGHEIGGLVAEPQYSLRIKRPACRMEERCAAERNSLAGWAAHRFFAFQPPDHDSKGDERQ